LSPLTEAEKEEVMQEGYDIATIQRIEDLVERKGWREVLRLIRKEYTHNLIKYIDSDFTVGGGPGSVHSG